MTKREIFDDLHIGGLGNAQKVATMGDVGSSGGGIGPEWASRDNFGPTTPVGDYHNSPAGLIVDPNEPVRLNEATIDAQTSGTLIVNIYPFVAGIGGLGYPDTPISGHTFDVTAGTNTLSFGQDLYPLPSYFDGYGFSINQSAISLLRDANGTIPNDLGIVTLKGGSSSSGSTFDSHYHFFNLDFSYDRTNSGIYRKDEGGVGGDFQTLNGYHTVSPTVEDLGVELNSIISRADPGDVILVGNGDYFTSETVNVPKRISIRGMGANGDLRDPTGPTLTPTGTFPLFEAGDGIAMDIEGFYLNGNGTTTGKGIICHGRSTIRRVVADDWDNHVIHMHQRSADDNLNNSVIDDVSARSTSGSVVYKSNDSAEQRELQSMKIYVRLSFSNDWAINADEGFGNYYYVQQMEGNHAGGGIRMNVQRSLGFMTYSEGNVTPIFRVEDAQNTCVATHIGQQQQHEVFDFPHSNNMGFQLTEDNHAYIYRPSGTIDLAGNSFETTTPGEGYYLRSDNGNRYKIKVDDSGNLYTV